MSPTRLYVIGNGFDLYHEVRSRYEDFGKYVHENHRELRATFERYFDFEGNWSSLEESLARLDGNLLLEDAEEDLKGYGSDDWRDDCNHTYQSRIAEVVDALTGQMQKALTDWIRTLDLPKQEDYCGPRLKFDSDAIFLNFNYTDTLEMLYSVPASLITHLHGRAKDPSSKLILGHGVTPDTLASLFMQATSEDQDRRIAQGNRLLADYFSKTSKPTSRVIQDHSVFFSSLGKLREIRVIGHSLSKVDLPYFEKIVSCTDPAAVEWIVTYHDCSSKSLMRDALRSVGVPESRLSQVKASHLP